MPEVKEMIEQIGTAFEEFKKTNNKRLDEIEARGSADSLTVEKQNRINDVLTQLEAEKQKREAIELKLNRLELGFDSGGSGDPVKAQKEKYRKSFEKWVRKSEKGLDELELKAINITTDGDGAYAVPEELDRNIYQMLRGYSPMRQLCNVIQIGTSDYKKLVNLHGQNAAWVDEDDARTGGDTTPTIGQVTPYLGEIYSKPAATQQSLDDIFFDVESFLVNEIALAFSEAENEAFTDGTGTKQPKGFLAYSQSTDGDSSRTFGYLQYFKTGVAGGFKVLDPNNGVNPIDSFLDMIYAMRGGHLQNAVWQSQAATAAYIRAFKNNMGDYMWQPSIQAGQPPTFLGYPFYFNDAMDAYADDADAVAFGNFKAGYTIVDRMGIRMLRDPYSNKPYVEFYTTKRVGGMVVDSDAIKILKLAD